MIVANMATYPPRGSTLESVLDSVAHQVDQLNLVLNEYAHPPEFLEKFPNVHPIIPREDTKDVGKFYPHASGSQYVFLIDDDRLFPDDFVAYTITQFEKLGSGDFLGGYHASLYYKPSISWKPKKLQKFINFNARSIARYRKVFPAHYEIKAPFIVDQIGTGATILRSNHMPSYEYMRDSQKFVDVRLARWCFEHGITSVCLPRRAGWFPRGFDFDETIYRGFTKKDPPHVAEEIWCYAFKVPNRGELIVPNDSFQ